MRIAITTRATVGLALGAAAGVCLWCMDRPSRSQSASLDVTPSPPELVLEPSSSSIEHEPGRPPPGPFYASLFVANTTWDLPCRFGDEPSNTQRCHVDSVEVTPTQTSARIACWYVHDHEDRPRDPAINTYIMTARGLFINGTEGHPMFTPHPIPTSLPKRWGMEPPKGLEPDYAWAMVRHHGAWCYVYEMQGMDTGYGDAECISDRGLVGMSNHRDFGWGESCGDTP